MSRHTARPSRFTGRGQTRPVRPTHDRAAALAAMRERHARLIESEIRFLSIPR